MNSLFDKLFEQMSDPIQRMLQLNAIWLEKSIRTSREVKRRITTNDLIYIENGELKDCEGQPTHKIKLLHGNLANTVFSITVENLLTNELSIINL